jgi:nanoRNase/pAp phosphatase (c-di-AMP/oligoRNAs hydrolase)
LSQTKYRLVTRSDFDGLVCGVLLSELGMIDEVLFVHPKDMQDGKIKITGRDITTNLPYTPQAYLVLDHHESEATRNTDKPANYIIEAHAPSAARVVYQHFGGKPAFPRITDALMDAVDKADSAQYARDEILNPTGWTLLNFVMDSRTGLGRFRDFRISNYQLMMGLIKHCSQLGIDQILAMPDVQERVSLYAEHAGRAREQILRCAKQRGNLVVLDLRHEDTVWVVNRFMIYALFPTANISLHVMPGMQNQNTVLAVGKSVLDRSSKTHVGNLMLAFGGGGHQAAGTCQVANEQADEVIKTLIQRINTDG